MSNDRRVLGLKKTPAQKQTERFEDELMQKVAGDKGSMDDPVTVDGRTFASESARLAHNAAAEEKLCESPPSPIEEVLVLDEQIPYAIVGGQPGVSYIQGKNFYDRAKRFVREAPMAEWYFAEPVPKKKSAMALAEEARAELKQKGMWHNVPGHDAPRRSALDDIERENARAAAAEQNAA